MRYLWRSLRVRFQSDLVVDSVAETLFASQVPLRRLHRDVPQKELNLLQFTTGLMAKTGASPTEVMWSERRNLTILCFLLYNTQMTLGLNPVPQILPALLIDRRSVPVAIPAALIQASIPAFTQSGTGMVRM